MPSRRSIPHLVLVLQLAATASCGTSSTEPGEDDDTGAPPTMAEVAGDYEATRFIGGGYDVLGLGGSLDLTLGADGSLAGTLHIPPDAGGPLTADMAGTYVLTGNTLMFEQDADTFVRDAGWTWSGGRHTRSPDIRECHRARAERHADGVRDPGQHQ